MNARVVLILLAIVVIAGGGWFLFRDAGDAAGVRVETIEGAGEPAKREVPALPSAPPTTERATAAPDVVHDSPGGDSALPESYRRGLGAIVGRIVEVDHAPVAAMNVELLGASLPELLPSVDSMFDAPPAITPTLATSKTDADGRFRFEGMEPGRFHALGVDLGGARATFRMIDSVALPGEVVDLGDISLDPFITVTGRVVDEDDRPVANARVRGTNLPGILFQFGAADFDPSGALAGRDFRSSDYMVIAIPSWARATFDRLPIPQTTTDADGKFTLAGLPQGQSTIIVDHADLLTLTKGPMPTGKAGGTKDVGKLVLEPGEELSAQVVGGDGKPLANAAILVGTPISGGMIGAPSFMKSYGKTGADGRFTARGLKDNPCLVAVKPEDALDWRVFDGITPGADSPVLRFDPTVDLKVIAVDAGGKPVPQVDLLLRLGTKPAEIPLMLAPVPLAGRTTKNEDGSLTVARLAPQKYTLLVRAAGFATAAVDVDLTAGPQTATARMEAESSLAVRVTAAADGAPLEHALVRTFAGRELWNGADIPVASARTGKDGSTTVNHLRAGKATIEVEHPDCASVRLEVDVPGRPVDVALTRGGSIAGKIHRGAAPPDEPRFLVLEEDHDRVRFTVSALDGAFKFVRVKAGTWRVMVFHRFANGSPGSLVSSLEDMGGPEVSREVTVVEGQEVPLDVDLLGSAEDGPTATLRGRVLMNGSPLADALVNCRPSQHWDRRRTARTDADGRFDLGAVPAGPVHVGVDPKDMHGGWSGFWAKNFTLQANEVRELLVDLSVGSIAGVVVNDAGKPVPLAMVSITSGEPWMIYGGEGSEARESEGSSMYTQTDEHGRFAVDPVTAAKLTVQVSHDDYAPSGSIEATVPPRGAAPELRIVLQKGENVTGILDLPQDVDPATLMVWCERDGANNEFNTNAEFDAKTRTFTAKNLAPGKYRMNLWRQSANDMLEPIPFEVAPGGFTGRHFEVKKLATPVTFPASGGDGEDGNGGGH